MNRLIPAALLGALLVGCASAPTQLQAPSAPAAPPVAAQVGLFSAHPAGPLPAEWEPLSLLRDKKPTAYRLVSEGERVVLHALAKQSSSALMHTLSAKPEERPWLRWQWKLGATPMLGATPAERGSPVRIVLGFDGDKGDLPFSDQILFETAKLITGHDFPYATLMYVWAEDLPVGTVVNSRHSSRIRMVVAASGPQQIGNWSNFSRNIVADFERAFGEPPGRLLGVGVLTDDDASEEPTEAWYGDIQLSRDAGAVPGQLLAGQRQ